MNPIGSALRHPYTVLAATLAAVLAGCLAILCLPVDILPAPRPTIIHVVQPYTGMDPAQMEGLTTGYEEQFLNLGGLQAIDSRSVQGAGLMTLSFRPGTDMARAVAETSAAVSRAHSLLPPGTEAPLVSPDSGAVPVGYLVLSSDARTIGELQDLAMVKLRPLLLGLDGVVVPPAFGGSPRTVVVQVEPDRLRAQRVSAGEVIAALSAGNAFSPSGQILIHDQVPMVPFNAMVAKPGEIGNIPVRRDPTVYIRDVATVADSTDGPSGYALVNGRRAVYLLIAKCDNVSTSAVVDAVKTRLQAHKELLPADVKLQLELDQSPPVSRFLSGLGRLALSAALLAGLVLLLTLGDWRIVLIVAVNLVVFLLAASAALWLIGQTINLMTVGGLALASGLLVHQATVELAGIQARLKREANVAEAVRLSAGETTRPRLAALLCTLVLLLPLLFVPGPAHALLVPLALAAGCAIVPSCFLSNTLLTVLAIALLRPPPASAPKRSIHLITAVAGLLHVVVRWRWLVASATAVLVAALLFWLWADHPGLGTDVLPPVECTQLQLRLRARPGTRLEYTEELTSQALEAIKEAGGADNIDASVGYVGALPSSYPINLVYLWMGGPEEAVLRVALKPTSTVNIEEFKGRLRHDLPLRLGDWLRQKLHLQGMPESRIAERVRGLKISFEPAGAVGEGVRFAASAPIEIVVSGPDNRAYAEKLVKQLEQLPSLRDLQLGPPIDYPTVDLTMDRERAASSGISARDVADSLVAATSSSRIVVPNFWRDPTSGILYRVQVQVPKALLHSVHDLETLPVQRDGQKQILLRDLARTSEGTTPGEWAHSNLRRLVRVTANVQGEDLGRVAQQVGQARRGAGELPPGTSIELRGQVPMLQQMMAGLTIGAALALVAVLLLLIGILQSIRLALIALVTVPVVLVGVAAALVVTGTSLNLASLVGILLALGVALTDAVMLIASTEHSRLTSGSTAGGVVEATMLRLSPTIAASGALIAAMLPLALALGPGGEAAAGLGRAAIGGLTAAAAAGLFVLPGLLGLVRPARTAGQAVSAAVCDGS